MKNKIVKERFNETVKALEDSKKLTKEILLASKKIITCFKSGHKLLIAGNGGSAADSQHIAAELVGKFYNFKRRALPAIALTTNSSILTSIGNDFGFDQVFTRQIEAFGRKGDVFLCLSTSGNSKNIVDAAILAKKIGLFVISLTGLGGGELKKYSDICLAVPSTDTPTIQNVHLFIYHQICELVEKSFI